MEKMMKRLFELAMHDRQYRDYKSGVAKKRFLDDLQRAKDAAMAKSGFNEEEIKSISAPRPTRLLRPKRTGIVGSIGGRSVDSSFYRS